MSTEREVVSDEAQDNIADMDLSPSIPGFNSSNKPCVNIWTDKLRKGVLSCSHFKEHWRIWVPKIYSPEPNGNCLDWSFDEDKAQEILYNTLEQFICNGEPQEVLKQLSQTEIPPSVCGKFFKMGEPTYSCRECGMDATCVLCVDCFKRSAHRNHKYKMGTSNGGGCCDCGDTEAWKSEPYCEVHLAGLQAKESSANKLPDDITERARATFQAVLKYCFDLLSLEHTPGLPADLCVKDTDEDRLSFFSTEDTYCTVLYNDETHTFEQVITTLTRVIKCSQKDAIEYVTNIDREGRAVVKCSGFQHCNELKCDIERFTQRQSSKALKVLVVHAHVVAHQIFAMKLLSWLQQFIGLCEGFRVIFSNVALNTKLSDKTIVEGILMRDSQLWKSARTAWHRLFISGMLMDYESKKALAIVFTRNYGSMIKDFIRDDHDHSFSIVSLSVQLFTVPTLAHHLIEHHDVLLLLLTTFISESNRQCNAAGKIEFERNTSNIAFKRAHFVLSDLRYLLSVVPDKWTMDLRHGFLGGLVQMLSLLGKMQWMDSSVRQVGQHMEYEPDWEPGFNLQIKLSPVITLALEWCGSDRVVLIKTFRHVMKLLSEQANVANTTTLQRDLANHKANCLHYDVVSEPVSVHIPLTRFLAGLYLHLEKYNLNFQSSELNVLEKPFDDHIIEPVLRAQVMIAQVHAGMWRRNGYSVINQVYFHHNVKCRSEMLDRDVILLQAGAAMIESNEFLIHIVNKFNLLSWACADFETTNFMKPEEDSMRQTINLVEEFLGLLITIVGERYMPGIGHVTNDDRLKKEIIQQLCIKPLPHSELNKALPEDVRHETGIEKVIDEVADFKKPTQLIAGKGVYELKPEYYSEYNVFFYHYTKEELGNSEETQRKRRKNAKELECSPPPKLPRLRDLFSPVVNLLQCDVMLHIMQMVLQRASNLTSRSFSEPQIHKILHLIGYALQEQESGYYPFMNFTECAAKFKIFDVLQELSGSSRIEAHKDLLKWTLDKYKEVSGSESSGSGSTTSTQNPESTERTKHDKEWRTMMAAQKRAKIMEQMAQMQKHFMQEHAKMFEEAAIESGADNERGSTMDLSETIEEEQQYVAIGAKQSTRYPELKTYTCILCQEDQTVTPTGPGAMVLAAFVQQSTVLCQNRTNIDEPDPLYLSAKLGAAPHTNTCGHVMHLGCWDKYFNNVMTKETRRPYRMRQPASFDVEKKEYLCPLCECLSNTALPLLPPLGSLQPTGKSNQQWGFDKWLNSLAIALDCTKEQRERLDHSKDCRYCAATMDAQKEQDACLDYRRFETCPLARIHKECGAEDGAFFEGLYNEIGPNLRGSVVQSVHHFAEATYTKGLGVDPHDEDSRVPLLSWKSTAYTIHAVECQLRDSEKPLLGSLSSRQRDSIEGLTRISALIGCTKTKCSDSTEATWWKNTVTGNHGISLLTMLLENPHDGPSILEWDAFGVLVPLVVSLPVLFSCSQNTAPNLVTGGLQDFYAFRLVFLSLISRILVTMDLKENEAMDVDIQEADSNAAGVATILEALQIEAGSEPEIWRRVREACLPFLRCCVLYFHYLTDVPAPPELMKKDGDTFENMCKYLGLGSSCRDLLGNEEETKFVVRLIQCWRSHPNVKAYLSGTSNVIVVKEPLKVNSLVSLPEDYSELINAVSMFICPNSDREDSRNPTMCLVCEEMLCSQSYCCQTELSKNMMVGACTYHASKCGAGVGIFLRVRECEVLFLRSPNRGCFITPPYLDEYGEPDQGLRRGNPLRLCAERYKKLSQLWLNHSLHENIARIIETSSNQISTQWQHL